ncbi:MAG: hypothetical protein ACTTKN_06605 [Phocaeicola sp.]|uniref:hypothetical protein n=1 Tax=Phocaeicola sp. TaxID=2773926 RepID=UPI003F9EDD14
MELTKKQTLQKTCYSYEAAGFNYDITSECEFTDEASTSVPTDIAITVKKDSAQIGSANYTGGYKMINVDSSLSDEECKQVNNTIFDIFSFLLTKE